MPDDPLASFRSKITTPKQEPEVLLSGDYIAFDAKDKAQRLEMRRVKGPSHSPSYNWLLNVVWDNDHGNVFMLFYTFCTYKVKGRNLQHLVQALRLETASFIQEYDAQRWPNKPGDMETVIDSIEVMDSQIENTSKLAFSNLR